MRSASAFRVPALLALLCGFGNPTPAAASTSTEAPVFAGSFWSGFIDHWSRSFKSQDAVILTVIGVGLIGVVMICATKWKK